MQSGVFDLDTLMAHLRLSHLSPVLPIKVDDPCGSHAAKAEPAPTSAVFVGALSTALNTRSTTAARAQRYRRPMVTERREYVARAPSENAVARATDYLSTARTGIRRRSSNQVSNNRP